MPATSAVTFKVEGGVVEGVRDVSFQLHRGETIALVGESGSGKSVTARTVMRLLTKRATVSPKSRVSLSGKDILALSDRDMRKLRGNDITMIFQEPMSSLNPVYTIGQQLCEILHLHNRISRAEAMKRAEALLEEVHIPEPAARLRQYPHQMSGGQRQRVMIAMALANRPDILIADEPTTALDVTVQAQILNLIKELKGKYGMAVILITHDLTVVAPVLRLRLRDAGRRGERAQPHRGAVRQSAASLHPAPPRFGAQGRRQSACARRPTRCSKAAT